ncbi:YgiW/YdeI family stress tolerance OB fold protein [Glaciimonas soli]|uniref:NirD/YgiW/YdeI family stress tolerance protein n=1 Tax=Glaciimonas soli TaxID=2590999 RepID=A0A843YT80_9BURK|nr:NirD/YgiW/YdeI family stress tolerance protein [Glaciimonas soli]MQR00462.1 NirD/YgiW/YdeI family stress tolerance protein [Glaciimonas soli]
MVHINKLIIIAVLSASSTAVIAQGYSGPSTDPASKTTASPHYNGPSTVPTMTVKQLLANGSDDQYVTVIGKIVRHTGGEHYVFSDASGEMKVEISHKHFPANTTINATTLVEITGKFDKNLIAESELDVKKINVITA